MSTSHPNDLSLSILLIEDNPGDARLFGELLAESELEAEHRWVSSLAEGLEEARQETCDIAVVDLDLPDSEGLETVQKVVGSAPDLPVVVTTGLDDLDTATEALGVGASEYLRKDGLTPALLARTLRMAVERHRLEREASRQQQISRSILESLPEHVALLEADGTIRAVNQSWRRFAETEGGDPRGYVGDNYLRVTREAAAAGNEDAPEVLEGLRGVLEGQDDFFAHEYPCHGPDERRWFRVEVTPLLGGKRQGGVISHVDVSDRVQREQALEETTSALRERIKEQACLQDVTRLLHEADRDIETCLQEVVDRLPEGWQYPEVTEVRLRLGSESWTTAGFRETDQSLTSPVRLAKGDEQGALEVAYLEERPEAEIGPFITEEQELLEALAREVSVAVDRWRTRRELEAERVQLVEVFRNSPAWITTTSGPGHVFEMANPTFRELVGDRELIGRPAPEAFPELEGDGYAELLDHVYETGETVEREELPLRLETDGGTELRYVNLVHQPRQERGEIVGVITHGVDVTEQVEQREAARKAEEKWAKALELAPVGIAISHPETAEYYAINQACAEMLGFEPEEIVGRTAHEISFWHDEDRRDDFLARLREQGAVREELMRFRTASGEVRDGRLSVNALELAGQDRLIWTLLDVTDQRETERRFRQMAENIDEVFWLRDPANEELLYLSPAYEDIWGRPVEETYRDPTRWMEAIHPEDRDRVRETALDRERDAFEHEYRVVRPDGEVRWIQDQAFPVVDEEGNTFRVAGVARDITQHRKLREQLQQQALHDPLTELANRTLFDDRLQLALAQSGREREPMGLLMIDVNDFKRVNDELGHTVGDQVLIELARRLETTVRETDTVARWGGDEFAVVLPGLNPPSVIDEMQTRLRDALEAPVRVGTDELQLTVTIGGVVQTPENISGTVDAADPEELVRFADIALHHGKRRTPGAFNLLRPEEDLTEEKAGLRLEQDLRRGLEAGEITVFYQPIWRITDGSLWGLEALARWHHPDRGMVAPGEFIPLAERVGLIHELGEEIGRQSCEQIAAWGREGTGPADLRLALNLSARQLQAPDLAERTSRWLEASGLAAERLVAEVTETAIMKSAGQVEAVQALGVPFFIDDFGTGYSTYTYLRELDVQGLKVDMSFVQRLGHSSSDQAIVESMTTLGRRLGLQVIAEGIETEAQREELERIGCSLGQGYHLSRPAPADEIAQELLS